MTNEDQHDEHGKHNEHNDVRVLPVGTLTSMGYRIPGAADPHSMTDVVIYPRDGALQLARAILMQWEISAQDIDGYLSNPALSNEELGDLLAVSLLIPVLFGEGGEARFFVEPHPRLAGRSPWEDMRAGKAASRRVRDWLLGQAVR